MWKSNLVHTTVIGMTFIGHAQRKRIGKLINRNVFGCKYIKGPQHDSSNQNRLRLRGKRTGATSGAGTSYSSGAPEFTPDSSNQID